MGWELWTLEGISHTVNGVEQALQADATVLSTTPIQQLVVDNNVLETLKSLSGVDISPIVNNLGETVGYAAKGVGTANGVTGLSNTWTEIHKTAVTVTQDLIDAARPLYEGGDTSSLNVGDTITKIAPSIANGVGGVAGTGVGLTALSSVAGPAIAAGLGVLWGNALYELNPTFWTGVADALTTAGKMFGDKVLTFFNSKGESFYDEDTINIIRDLLIQEGYLSEGDPLYKTWNYTGDTSIFDDPNAKVITGSLIAHRSNTDLVIKAKDYGVIKGSSANRTIVAYARTTPETYVDYSNPSMTDITDTTKSGPYYTHHGTPYYVGTSRGLSIGTLIIVPEVSIGSQADIATILFDGPVAPDQALVPVVNTLPYVPNGTAPDGSTSPQVTPIDTSNTSPLQRPVTTSSSNPQADPYPYFDPRVGPQGQTDVEVMPVNPYPDPNPQVDPSTNPDPNPTDLPNETDQPEELDPTPIGPTNPPLNPDVPNPPAPPSPPTGSGGDDGNGDTGTTIDPTPLLPPPMEGLGNIYNPSSTAMHNLAQYMWSSTTIEDIKKLFQNPTDGIISFMKLYVTPHTGGYANICLGYLDSQVQAPLVTAQVKEVDCGELHIPLNYGNATDYPPYTSAQAYLPFIGIVQLNPYDIVDSDVNIKYRVDCYTGACVAQIKCSRYDMDAKLYEFSGNCAQQLPLTSGSFVQAVGNTIAGAVMGGITGGAIGAAIGAGAALIHSNVEVGRSGNLSANAGILGSRIPYIILTRPLAVDAAAYPSYYGYPANKTVYLSNCSGFIKVKDIILHCSCTDEERDEILSLLKSGVYF